MSYKLFIDDIRNPLSNTEWIIARSFDEAIDIIHKKGELPIHISFDHDLGNEFEKTGYDIAKWIVEQDMNGIYTLDFNTFTFNVHSANPVGKTNIEEYLFSYNKFKVGK